MAAAADQLKQAMPFTTRYPELGTGPVDVGPMIDPELFELERERIFRQVWLYVARAEELAEPGDYKLRRLDVANTSVIIVRDKSGEVPEPALPLYYLALAFAQAAPHNELYDCSNTVPNSFEAYRFVAAHGEVADR